MAAMVKSGEMALDVKFFYEDEIFRMNEKNQVNFGLVLETSDNYSADDDVDHDAALSKGHVRVAWHPVGKEEVLLESAIGLADRTLMPGDVVRRLLPGKETQRGYCREIKMEADVQISGTKFIVKNVAAERLTSLMAVPKDSAVCLDSWVGSTKCIDEKVILMSPCGALIEVPDVELCDLKDRNAGCRSGLFKETVFYPGQILRGRIDFKNNVKLLTPSIALKTNKEGKFVTKQFIVQSVHTHGVWVNWQCRAFSEEYHQKKNSTLSQPKTYVTGDDLKRLKRLNLFESCMLQINDKNYLKLHESDIIIRKSHWQKDQAIKYSKLLSNGQKNLTSKDITGQTPAQVEKCQTRLSIRSFDNGKQYSSTLCCSLMSISNVETTFKTKETTKTFNIQRRSENVKTDGNDEWLTDEDFDEDKSETNSVATTISNDSNETPKNSPKKCYLIRTKKIKNLKKKGSSSVVPKIGEKLVTEALIVRSLVTVVWQDGSIEAGIPSTQLYPIHHLDDHEFFPGDFVLSNSVVENPLSDYGVVQNVDHQGRTARVKWFRVYTSLNEDRPTYAGESEVSVYDLKDHSDFQFRPGTIVTRIGNFVGLDAAPPAGQVIDNYTDGLVKVWWVNGHISMCWPQDLFEIAQYDGDPNLSNESENNSWITESEETESGDVSQNPSETESLLALQLERASVAMSRLEEIFTFNPKLQSCEIMRNLLTVYKKCRYLDRLIGTSFFHEHHFKGLIERVRKGGRQTKFELCHDNTHSCSVAAETKTFPGFVTPSRCANKELTQMDNLISEKKANLFSDHPTSSKLSLDFDVYEIMTFHKNSSETSFGNALLDNKSFPGDVTGNFQNLQKLDEDSEMKLVNKAAEKSVVKIAAVVFENESTEFVCARLCALLKVQLVRALNEIQQKYAKPNFNPGEATKNEIIIPEDDDPNGVSPSKKCVQRDLATHYYESFQILELAPSSHKFHFTIFHPSNMQLYVKAVKREHKLLRTCLPTGIWVRAFEDRMDLMSIMIAGPKGTPYEDGMFFFDVQLGREYPKVPPVFHYISFCSDRLNPNLYEDGKVCISLLGTWSGRESEIWGPKSTLLQVIISIQGLILVAEPYFNEAGYERQKGTQQGKENSRMYNEMVILKVVQSMSNIISSPPEIFRDQITSHFKRSGLIFYNRVKSWMKIPPLGKHSDGTFPACFKEAPMFPLIPTSRGFCLTLTGLLESFRRKLDCFISKNSELHSL